jgi:hypothetical protein
MGMGKKEVKYSVQRERFFVGFMTLPLKNPKCIQPLIERYELSFNQK